MAFGSVYRSPRGRRMTPICAELPLTTSSGHSRIPTADVAVGESGQSQELRKRSISLSGTESRAARWTMAGMSGLAQFFMAMML